MLLEKLWVTSKAVSEVTSGDVMLISPVAGTVAGGVAPTAVVPFSISKPRSCARELDLITRYIDQLTNND